jgi:hypothetical protein
LELLQLASSCLQAPTVTNRKLQQLDKEMWGCLIARCENSKLQEEIYDLVHTGLFSHFISLLLLVSIMLVGRNFLQTLEIIICNNLILVT